MAETKEPKIMTKPLPAILDELEAMILEGKEATRQTKEAEKAALTAAIEAREAGIQAAGEARKAAELAVDRVGSIAQKAVDLAEQALGEAQKATGIAEVTKADLARKHDLWQSMYDRCMLAYTHILPLYSLEADVFIKQGEAGKMWGTQIQDKVIRIDKIMQEP